MELFPLLIKTEVTTIRNNGGKPALALKLGKGHPVPETEASCYQQSKSRTFSKELNRSNSRKSNHLITKQKKFMIMTLS